MSVSVILPADCAASTAVSDLNCTGVTPGLKLICTSSQIGLNPSPWIASITLTNDCPPGSAPSLSVVPRITAVNPGHAQPGAAFEIVGSSFGQPQAGDAVTVGGVAAPVSLWSDGQIVAAVPSGLRPGAVSVSVTVPGAPGPLTSTMTVDAAAAAASGAAAGALPGQPGAAAHLNPGATPGIIPPAPGGPVVTTNPPAFHRPVPQPGAPVTVSLAAASTEAEPGQAVPLTATVVAFGKPAVGTTVSFLLVVVPGGDATLSQPTAVTDQDGRATVTLQLSRTAGNTIVLARAGEYQDEIQVVGRGAAAAAAAAQAGSSGDAGGTPVLSAAGGAPQRLLIVGLLVVCLVLFLSGFAIQMRSSATSPAAAAAGQPRRSVPARVGEATQAGGAVLQLVAVVAAAGVGRVVARFRRLRP